MAENETSETVEENEISAGSETTEIVSQSEAQSSPSDVDVIEGDIVGRTWINPNVAADDPRRTRQTVTFDYTIPEGRPSFLRMIFGSVVMVTEEVTDRSTAYDEDTPREAMEAMIRQAASQERSIENKPYANLRYGTIGFISSALDKTQGGVGHLTGFANSAARSAGKIISPLWNSFLFAPLHEPAKRAEQAGENTVNAWIRRGRVEEVRSRALAEVSINNLVEESVTEITANPQVQMIVQEVIASQSTSLVGEIIDEARERLVSLDILLMGKLGRRPVATADFRQSYIQTLAQRHVRYQRVELANSLAGTFAGPVTRLVAFLLDVMVLIIALAMLSTFVSSTLNLFGLTDTVNNFLLSGGTLATILVLFIAFFNILMLSVYFIFSWNWVGATLGDLLLGVQVVNAEGGRVSFIRSTLRLIGGYISALVFFLGFIWALFDRRRQGWHDKFGATVVLYAWPAKPEETFLHEDVAAELADGD
jgi:uncharacterized RDD family membrane protein YckC